MLVGIVVLNGTIVQSPVRWRKRGDTTITGRDFTISGSTIPEKSHTSNVPALGWKTIGIVLLFYMVNSYAIIAIHKAKPTINNGI